MVCVLLFFFLNVESDYDWQEMSNLFVYNCGSDGTCYIWYCPGCDVESHVPRTTYL